MEWEVMFMCNLLGVTLLVMIALFHVIGNEPEENGETVTFKKEDD